MNLIDSYVREVGRRLPRGKRGDVETELRSLLQDMVEDRAGVSLQEADEADVIAVLREMGPPQSVAASYQPRANYLIGPQVFPILRIGVTISAVIVAIVTLVGVAFSIDSSDPLLTQAFELLLGAIPGYIDAMLTAFVVIVIILAIVERVVPAEDLAWNSDEEWDPTSLAEVPTTKRVDRFGAIVSIVVNIGILALLNLYPHWIGLTHSVDGVMQSVPMLSENFYATILPWANLSIIATITYQVIQLFAGHMTRRVRLVGAVSDLITAAILYLIITHPPLFGVNESIIAAQGWQISSGLMSGATGLVTLLNTIARFALPIGLVASVLSAAYNLYKAIVDSTDLPPLEFVRKAG